MEQLVIAAFGAFAGWIFLRMLLPFRLPNRLAPVIIGAIAFGVLSIPDHRVQLSVAAVSGVLLIHNFLQDNEVPGPWRFPRIRVPRPQPRRRELGKPTGTAFRPDGEPGRRIPRV